MPFIRNKYTKAIITILVIFIVLSGMAYFGNNPVQKALYSVISPIYNGAYELVTPIRKFFDNMNKAVEFEREIEALKKEVTSLKIENKTREDYIVENKRLKELLDLKDSTMESYQTITARVVSYEPNSWYDTVMLSKGSKDGINLDDIVITNLGVVGRIVDCGSNWSKVSTVLNSSNSIGVKLSRTGDIGVVSGDAGLAQDKNAKLEYLSNDKNLINGDIIVTSGLGGVYPPDLPIGKVVSIRSDSAGNLDYGVVEPSVDFSSLYEVLVITGNVESVTISADSETENQPAETNNDNIEGEQTSE